MFTRSLFLQFCHQAWSSDNKKGNIYISPDKDGHNGGVWKMAKDPNQINNREKRLGTYDENLKRIGD